MESRNIYLYWVGKEYKLISILRNLIYLHSTSGKGYNVNLITEHNIKDYIKDIPEYFNKLLPAHQADFVRVHVICDYGGIWLDSDTLVLDSLDTLFHFIETNDGFFIKENNNILCNGIFGSKPNTPFMNKWKTDMMNKLNNTQGKIEWSDIGCIMLQSIYTTNKALYDNYKIFNGLDNLYPVNWNNCVKEFLDKPYDNYKSILREYQPLVVLVNSVYKRLESMTEQEIFAGKMPLNYFINKSLENKDNLVNNIYLNLINSSSFIDNLNYLNTSLKDELIKHNYEPVLIGNLFYDHQQDKPFFYTSPLLNECEEKRIRLMKASKMRSVMFEIGVNGGHSSFLSLMSNENIKIYGNDIAEFYKPCYICHPEIYVLKAVNVLEKMFNGRFTFIKGNCLTEVPKFVKLNPDLKINIVHIDGAKDTYKEDFFNIMPLLEDETIVIFDDSNIKSVQDIVNSLINNGYLYRMLEFPKMNTKEKYTNEILLYKKDNNKKRFENIYEKHLWNDGNINIPLSGPGSSLENTKECSKMLNDFIYNNHCKTVIDLGCGDLTWIPKMPFFNDSNIKYTGIDIVESLINSHTEKYPGKLFINADISIYNDFDNVDIIIIRDVIFHLKNKDILSIFYNIKNKFKYILITSCINDVNTDIFDRWHFSQKNIHIEPFNIPRNFEMKIYEEAFKRNVYIYSHNSFYNIISS